MPTTEPTYGERLWAEAAAARLSTVARQVARDLGVPTPSDSWSPPVPGPYLLVGGIVLFDVFVLHAVQQVTVGRNTVLDNPSWLALPATVLLALFTNRYARDRYDRALREVRMRTRTAGDPAAFERLVSTGFKRRLFVVAVGGYYAYLVVTGRIPTIVAYEGLAGLFGWLVVIPFAYAPVLVETVAMYFSLHFSLPRRFGREDVRIYYLDPHNLGGLRPVGDLLKHSYYLFTAAVVLVTALLYAPFVFPDLLYTPYRPPERFVTAVVAVLWAVGVASIGFSLTTLHRYMRKRRREKLRSLESQVRDLVTDPYDVEQILDDEEGLRRFEREYHRIEQVRETKEYPATLAMWVQILVSVVLPLVVQRVVRWVGGVV